MSITTPATTVAFKKLATQSAFIACWQETNAEIHRRLNAVESINNMLVHEINRLLAEVAELKTVCA
jgi:hypothetical protein